MNRQTYETLMDALRECDRIQKEQTGTSYEELAKKYADKFLVLNSAVLQVIISEEVKSYDD